MFVPVRQQGKTISTFMHSFIINTLKVRQWWCFKTAISATYLTESIAVSKCLTTAILETCNFYAYHLNPKRIGLSCNKHYNYRCVMPNMRNKQIHHASTYRLNTTAHHTAAWAAFFLPLDSASDESMSELTTIFFGAFVAFGLLAFAFGSALDISCFFGLLTAKSKSLELSKSTAFLRPAPAVVFFAKNTNNNKSCNWMILIPTRNHFSSQGIK